MQAAQDTQLPLDVIPPEEAARIRWQLELSFVDPTIRRGPLWEQLGGTVSVQDPDGFKHLPALYPTGRLYIFFEEKRDALLRAENSIHLVDLLGESPPLVTYISDENLRSLVALNDHDYIILAGTPPGGRDALPGAMPDG